VRIDKCFDYIHLYMKCVYIVLSAQYFHQPADYQRNRLNSGMWHMLSEMMLAHMFEYLESSFITTKLLFPRKETLPSIVGCGMATRVWSNAW